ncbi:hypothetical protein HBI23_255350 [Parastagonospora nodorum]|nr:hypothetical protein HBI23_255350 [Parastagonospora nodorum]KAH5621694.1 hypothetical protein HBI51_249340 [Parastagonospora nodorum]KAH6132296.1 hypothetical protein HBI68_255480 [Parastagonospora nodorum]KAH6380570.1 hypothetical protein HBI08_235290 [Parastagonospora nodorum]KAH6383065.1 hypothetical protein HBI60_258890 [Parastagonospora nodorum]
MHSWFGNMLVSAIHRPSIYQHLLHDTTITPLALDMLFERNIGALKEDLPTHPLQSRRNPSTTERPDEMYYLVETLLVLVYVSSNIT